MNDLPAIVANMRHAIRNRQTVQIGGGKFNPQELNEAVLLIENGAAMLKALERLTHPMATDEDVTYAMNIINTVRGAA